MTKRNILVIIFTLALPAILFSQAANKIVKDPLGGGKMLYGEIDTSALSKPPFSEWFLSGLERYEPDTEIVVQLINNMAPEYNYIIVMGTWCPDSHREVPRMLKVLYLSGVPESHITIYAVNRELAAKRTPVKKLNIKRVPTLIVKAQGEEIGRIIESPKKSIEKDLLNILSGGE